MLIISIIGAVIKKIQLQLFFKMGYEVNKDLKADIYGKILKMPYEWFER